MNSFTLDEIYVGQKASVTKTITRGDIYAFAGLVDDYSPVHIDKAFGEQSPFGRCIAHGFLSGACSAPWRAITCQAQAASMCARA